MTLINVTTKHGKTVSDDAAAVSRTQESGVPSRGRVRIGRFLITLATLAVAGALGSAAWSAYTGAPWTRDAAVRAYAVTMAPEVAGRIVELPVADNNYVRKGDLLMVIDPTNYTIAASQAEAAVQQAHASIENIDAQIEVQQAQINASQAQLDRARAALVFAQQQPARYQTLAKDGYRSV
jgi:multidrug resistance efflux pump